MKAKHTPGPWEAQKWNVDDWIIKTKDGYRIGGIKPALIVDIEPATHNAMLMAAAPELLEALERCLKEDAGDLEAETVHMAMEAIKKAKGDL